MIGFFNRCGNILPADFTQELSEYEILCKVLTELSELDKKVDDFAKTAKAYTDSKFNETMNTINNLENLLQQEIENAKQYAINTAQNYTDEQLSTAKTYLEGLITLTKNAIEQKVADLALKIDDANEVNRIWVIAQIQEMWQQIENIGEGQIIVNPITQRPASLQSVINDLWNLTNRGGITCGEYDGLAITCEEYDRKNITCYQYDTDARKRLCKDYRFLMFYPDSGNIVNYKRVIEWLTSLHMDDTLTARDYDDLGLTCDQFISYQASAWQYDWKSLSIYK